MVEAPDRIRWSMLVVSLSLFGCADGPAVYRACIEDDECANGESGVSGSCVARDGGGSEVADAADRDSDADGSPGADGAPGDATADGLDGFEGPNACGGVLPLADDGVPVTPGDRCGCGGTYACNGPEAVRCAGRQRRTRAADVGIPAVSPETLAGRATKGCCDATAIR